MSTVYLNGSWVDASDARVSVDDRGFLLADGIYEVTPAYHGRFLLADRHRARFERGLNELRIPWSADSFGSIHERLLEVNELREVPAAIVYLQVTRGAAPRTHAFPNPPVEPTVYAFSRAWTRPDDAAWSSGGRAITTPDLRWGRCDIKSIALLPNVLAQQAAVEAGATDAILVRDGVAMEGAHSNLWVVLDGVAVTHPANERILHGITRGLALELAPAEGIAVAERPIAVEELRRAEEVFMTGTTAEIHPVVRLDGVPVGAGEPGPVTRRLKAAFDRRVAALG